jgi:hypothetical protein
MENNIDSEKLLVQMKELTKQVAASNSSSRRFLLGIVQGFGTVIGATLLVALVLFILGLLAKFGIFSGFSTWLVETIGR